MRGLTGRLVLLGSLAFATAVPDARAAFPYKPQGAPTAWNQYFLPAGADQTPNDLTDKRVWMYAATPEPGADPAVRADRRELHGVRGAHLADAADVDQAWRTTTGRPDVTIAVLDSGIKWNDLGGMLDVRLKTRISRRETPVPEVTRAQATEPGQDCSRFRRRRGHQARDLNGDGVFNIADYACDARVDPAPRHGVGPAWPEGAAPEWRGKPMLDPQDVLIAFSDAIDGDANGFADDIVGWDFLDDDNDPFDDVQYGHGTGEARDSAGEADNGGDLGTCPNCMQIHMRVGTSFIADVNRFALAVVYAADNDVQVVQEALGTLNKSRLGADAVKYAYDHGTVVIASAADEAAQHHNWPSSYPYSIVVNSVTHADETDPLPYSTYLAFNGCTNFSSRITLAIPSVSCSSDATGRGAGMAGIIYSAALNAIDSGQLRPHPTCRDTDGDRCSLSANEVRQLMASGAVDGELVSDDVNFSQDPLTGVSTELGCRPIAVPGCHDPFLSAPNARVSTSGGRSYPARAGHDQFYGYGRVNMNRAVDAIVPPGAKPARIPPEVEVASPGWYEMVDPAKESFAIEGEVAVRGREYSCKVMVAAGSYPSDAADFVEVASPVCNEQSRTEPIDGLIASVPVSQLEALFPANAGDHTGPEPGRLNTPEFDQPHSGRPNTEPYAFVAKVVATSKTPDGVTLTGQDRRQAYLHRDADMLPGFPKQLEGDAEASPVLADLDGDNRTELIVANSDGVVHAWRRDGSEARGFPVHTDPIPALHPGSRAFGAGGVPAAYGAVLATPAVGDLDLDGAPEVVVADLEGKVYVFASDGTRRRSWQTPVEYSGKPLEPFVNVRGATGDAHQNRTQLGFIGAPVLADVDGDDGGGLEIVAASMDRHVYVWNPDGSDVAGWPQVVVDPSKVQEVDPATHRVTFKDDVGADYDQGAIIATPAVGNIDGDREPEIVVGTNESYKEPLNAGGLDETLYAPLGAALDQANGRLFALEHDGRVKAGWPFKVGILQAGILPMVGEGISGAPVIGSVPCNGAAAAPRVGVIPAAGVPYVINPDGQSCYGRTNGKDVGLPTAGGPVTDQPFLPAFGHPVFARTGMGDVFLAPAAGLQRAVDVVLPEYQGGHDYLVAWQTATGKIAPGWPAEMNDLQFLTGPSVAELNAATQGEEVVSGSASDDLQGFAGAGTDFSPSWPKMTGDWMVANPATGAFGQLETDPATRKVVIAATRSGQVMAYATSAPACAPASWPQFHHDMRNTGDTRTDAVPPGRPTQPSVAGRTLRFGAPGDDLLCGTAKSFEVVTSDRPIRARGFARAKAVAANGATPAAGSSHQLALEGALERFVAVRAVDDSGNVGRPAVVDRHARCVRRHGKLRRGMSLRRARRVARLKRVGRGIYVRRGSRLALSVSRRRIRSMALVRLPVRRDRIALRATLRRCAR